MKKIYSLIFALFIGVAAFGQAVTITHETFGVGGFWQGNMDTNPNLSSVLTFGNDFARTQNWNASKNYDLASGSFHLILQSSVPSDTIRFTIPVTGFSNVHFATGAYSWGALKDQFMAMYSTDGSAWTEFDETANTTGDFTAGAWQFLTFSEAFSGVDELAVKIFRTADVIHLDDIVITGEPTIDNALLSSVSLDVGSIDFEYYTNDYTVWVPYGTAATPVITAEAFDVDANVSIVDAVDITSATEADRTSTVTVTAEDGTTTNVYNIVFNVTPPRTDAKLSGISLSYATLAPAFNSARLRYLVDLPDTATVAPAITATLSDAAAATLVKTDAVDISAADLASRTTTLEVTAQDGVTTQTYEVVFKVGGNSTDLFVIDRETFGNEGIQFGIVLNTYAGFTSSWEWGAQTVNIRTSNPSTGYDGASGANRVEVQAGWGSGYDSLALKANTTGYKNVTLATGVYNNSGLATGASIAFKAYYSEDSATWTSIGNETQLETAFPTNNAWSYVILDDVLPASESLNILFANENANFEYWVDDITLWGTPLNTNNQLAGIALSEGTLEPAFDPNVLAYTVSLPQGSSVTPTATPSVLSPSAVIDQADAADIRSLDVADNTTTITVTAEDGSTRTYEIVFDVFMSSDATLKELSVENYPVSPAFSNDIAGYAVKLPAGTTAAPVITAVSEDDYASVTITGPVDITSADVADRTAVVEVVAEDQVTTKTFTLVFTTGSLSDVRFNFLQEAFGGTGTYEAEDYPGYTSGAMFDGDTHRWDTNSTGTYPLSSGGGKMKFGEWEATPTYVELVMKARIEGYTDIMVSYGLEHNSGGWGDGGCGLTNNFILIEYTLDSVTWTALDMDSLVEGSVYPCGGQPFAFVEMAEEIPVNDMGYVTLRFTHTDGKIHPFYIDDIVLSGSPISTDASLYNMTVDNGTLTPLFDPAISEYTVELPIGTTETPVITATPSEDASEVVISDAADVTSENVADRTSTVTVTAPDGVATMTYTVVFSVLPNNDATLSALEVSAGTLDPVFSPVTFDYDVELVPGSTATPTTTATANDPNAEVVVTDATDVTSATAADRTTTIAVTAEDGVSTLTYTILFTRSTVSVDRNSVNGLKLYPNPTESTLKISGAEKIESIRVTNVLGETMIMRKVSSDLIDLDVSALRTGYYFVTVKTADGNEKTGYFMKK